MQFASGWVSETPDTPRNGRWRLVGLEGRGRPGFMTATEGNCKTEGTVLGAEGIARLTALRSRGQTECFTETEVSQKGVARLRALFLEAEVILRPHRDAWCVVRELWPDLGPCGVIHSGWQLLPGEAIKKKSASHSPAASGLLLACLPYKISCH